MEMYPNKILEIQIRRDIYQFISKNPGFHFRKIQRDLNIPKSTLEYHLRYLKKHNLLIEQSEKHYVRFYIAKTVGERQKKIINILREKVPRNIILYLCLYNDATQADILRLYLGYDFHVVYQF